MHRFGGGTGSRNTKVNTRRAFICGECGKSFRNGQDLFLHGEVCMLEAFELEASAIQASAAEMPAQSRRNQAGKGSIYGGSTPLQEVYMSSVSDAIQNQHKQSDQLHSAVSKSEAVEFAGYIGEELAREVEDDESDYEPPPVLELVDPLPKKTPKRIFPIGDDGKQIRPKMECPACGLILYRHNFSTHFRIHTGELPFQCSFCDKRFRTTSALTVHTRCHTGERPYECPHCNYCCITKRNLDRHIMNNHVKKGGRASSAIRRSVYYSPRNPTGISGLGAYANLDYSEDYEGGMEDIEDENLEEAELEEEAGISNITARQDQDYPQQLQANTIDGQNDNVSGKEGQTNVQSGEQTETTESNYEPTYKRLKTLPIHDGPKGVYGEEAEENKDQIGGRSEQSTVDMEKSGDKESDEKEEKKALVSNKK